MWYLAPVLMFSVSQENIGAIAVEYACVGTSTSSASQNGSKIHSTTEEVSQRFRVNESNGTIIRVSGNAQEDLCGSKCNIVFEKRAIRLDSKTARKKNNKDTTWSLDLDSLKAAEKTTLEVDGIWVTITSALACQASPPPAT